MADLKISQLTDYSTPQGIDLVPVVDTSNATTKKSTLANFFNILSSIFTIKDSSDTSKKVAFDVSDVTTATTRTLKIPNENATIVGDTAIQTITNKTLSTGTKINTSGSDASGDTYYRDASGNLKNLGIGTNGQIIQSDGTKPTWQANPAKVVVDVQTFTSSGTWTKPTNAKSVSVIVVGGGGSGASGNTRAFNTNSPLAGGGGGGGGAVNQGNFDASFLPSTVSITVGAQSAGGLGVASSGTSLVVGNNGNDGNLSSFGSYIIANGGKKGLAAGGGGNGGNVVGFGTSITPTSATAILGQGANGGAVATDGTCAEYGGAGGGGGENSTGAGNTGGSSIYGCGGGGGGGYGETVGTVNSGGNGGATLSYSVGGGGSGSAGGNPANAGIAGSRNGISSSGGGGSGSSWLASPGTGGAGGAGGIPGGGGGGAGGTGAGTGTAITSGAGGVGARGEVTVITYF